MFSVFNGVFVDVVKGFQNSGVLVVCGGKVVGGHFSVEWRKGEELKTFVTRFTAGEIKGQRKNEKSVDLWLCIVDNDGNEKELFLRVIDLKENK